MRLWQGFILAFGLAISANAFADTVRVGIIGPMSGADAADGQMWKSTIEAYQKKYGDSVGGNRIEFVYRDLPEFDPAKAKDLAQELIIKEKVQYLAGIYYTPEALAIAPLVQETQTPTVIFNAATPSILERSDYLLRVSYTVSQAAAPVAKFALKEGAKTAVTMVADYVSGITAETAFATTFEAGGGQIVDRIHVPLSTTDFGPLMQKVRAKSPAALFVFVPSGPNFLNVIKAFNENGLKGAGVEFLGTSQTDETVLPQLGDQAIGLITGHLYSPVHDSPENAALVKMMKDYDPHIIVTTSNAVAFDGASLIYKMVAATDGKPDGAKAIASVKGYGWMSPRGPVRIDPVTRQLIQNIYMRRVEPDGDGKLVNREFFTFPMQPADIAPTGAATRAGSAATTWKLSTIASILVDSAAYAMLLFMISIGLSLTQGLMRVINLSHGCFAMIGGYGAAVLPRVLGVGFALSVILALLVAALVALVLEKFLIRRYYQRPRLDQVLVTIGIIYIFTAAASLLFGNDIMAVPLPDYITGTVDLGFRVIPRHRLYVIGLGVFVACLLWFTIERSSFGLRIRAAVDNPGIAEAVGINTQLIYAVTFSLGAILGALGGVAGAELMPMAPTYANTYLLVIMAVVAVGGQGSLLGSFLAALLLGLVDTATKYIVPDMSSIAFYLMMFVVLLIRPRGLFGREY
jgi:branched-chain amino acid transport system substrate-binding protein